MSNVASQTSSLIAQFGFPRPSAQLPVLLLGFEGVLAVPGVPGGPADVPTIGFPLLDQLRHLPVHKVWSGPRPDRQVPGWGPLDALGSTRDGSTGLGPVIEYQRRLASRTPVVWCDAGLAPVWALACDWACNRDVPVLLISPDPSLGLTAADAAAIAAFVSKTS